MSNQDQQPPWGRKNKPQTPEEMVAQIIKKLQDYFSEGKKPSSNGNQPPKSDTPTNPFANVGKLLGILLIILVLQGVYSSIYKILPGEQGVILRFGQYQKTTEPGLRFKLPYIDTLIKVDVQTIRKEEFGFRTRATGQSTSLARRGVDKESRRGLDRESLMLTADKNVINVAWIVQYRVKDPKDFLFMVKNVTQAVRDISESVTRRIVGNMDFDYVLSNRDLLAASVKEELQAELDSMSAGIGIGTVQFQDINPPDPVKPAFNEVNEADQDMKRLVNEAEEIYNRKIPKASGDAKKIIEESYGYSAKRINDAQGETQRFLDILKEYRNAADVTRQRMYLETMQTILPTVQSVYVIDEKQQAPLPLLNITGSKGVLESK